MGIGACSCLCVRVRAVLLRETNDVSGDSRTVSRYGSWPGLVLAELAGPASVAGAHELGASSGASGAAQTAVHAHAGAAKWS